ncbi:SDR family oxidoreductase [Gordonia sp. OPL2]|uniref:SDR family NAD(P)-dependent oxidoreductase n=1 Tax=Gordonia sp. OPL2 TaxID=2486274 RepID=UPI0016562A3F|nr:SDR family NAD(P)-dependent oxidoreductase [Gordonia sp. OPL2]ROZ99315.1 SDR family NAD(P)-dependent oxidoreductase [Gordonia sp. OPL2]
MTNIENKVAVVTGAASGIGRALAVDLAAAGCRVSICDWDAEGLEETRARLATMGATVDSKVFDLREQTLVEHYASDVIDKFGAVNLVFNNAGVDHHGSVTDTSFKDYQRVMDVNFWGVVNMTKALLPQLITANEAHIVNVSSIFGLFGVGDQSAYNSSKFAVRGFTEALRIEMLASHPHLKVTCVHPGGVRTSIVKNATVSEGTDHKRMSEVFDKHLTITTPESASKTILRGVRRNQAKVLIGPDAHFFDLSVRALGSKYQRVGAVARKVAGALL